MDMIKQEEINSSSQSVALKDFCTEHALLQPNEDFVMKLPFLIRGEIRTPEMIPLQEIEKAFAQKDRGRSASSSESSYVQIGKAQVLREKIIDRSSMKYTGNYFYSIMPLFAAEEVITKTTPLELCNLPFTEVLQFAKTLQKFLADNAEFVDSVRETTLQTAELPDLWHNAGFQAFDFLLDPENLQKMVDHDLCAWQIPGHQFLDGWQKLPNADVTPAPVNLYSQLQFHETGYSWEPRVAEMRALPTRQLHITAGNSPQIPLISLLRAIATKSPAVVKSPFGATMPGSLIALAAFLSQPDHPITKNLSVIYWKGGDNKIEDTFFRPNQFDRIVVWGAPDAVLSVKQRALFSKVLTFNPRYGVSMIGKEVFEEEDLTTVAIRAVSDSLVANQKACIASQIHYVEGTDEQIETYASALRKVLSEFDELSPQFLPPHLVGAIKRLKRGAFLDGEWHENKKNELFESGVVVLNDEFNVSQHPMSRMIVVRKVESLNDSLQYMHHGVSTVSLYPEARRLELRDAIASKGVSNIVDLGQSGSAFMGMSHDGMMVLTELIDWKNG